MIKDKFNRGKSRKQVHLFLMSVFSLHESSFRFRLYLPCDNDLNFMEEVLPRVFHVLRYNFSQF